MQSFLKSGKCGPTLTTVKPGKSGTSTKPKKKANTPWVEKYRPNTIDDVVEQDDIVAVLKKCLNGGDLPHLLFYGPPGTGKTSTILAAAKQLFGDLYKERILELNASDERGIQVIRDKVKNFAQITASSYRSDGRRCPPFKIVILDEADSMTHAAQAALRRTMEKESKTTRFCLICNYVSRIIEPLTSRCTKFRFKPLGAEKIKERLQMISSDENIVCDSEALDALIEISGGDMRRAITSLQSCGRLKGKDTQITKDDVLEITGVIPPKLINEFIEVCRKGDYQTLGDFINDMILLAYSGSQLLEQLFDVILNDADLPDKKKALIFDKLALCSYRLQDGGSEYINLMDLGCGTIGVFQK